MLCLPCIVCKEATFPGHQNPHFMMEWYDLIFPPSKASSVHKDRSGAREATDCNRNGSVHGTHLFSKGCRWLQSQYQRQSKLNFATSIKWINGTSWWHFRRQLATRTFHTHLRMIFVVSFETTWNSSNIYNSTTPPTPSLSKRQHDLPFQAVSPQIGLSRIATNSGPKQTIGKFMSARFSDGETCYLFIFISFFCKFAGSLNPVPMMIVGSSSAAFKTVCHPVKNWLLTRISHHGLWSSTIMSALD